MANLYGLWAAEEGHPFDRDFFLLCIADRLQNGGLIPMLFVDGDFPIGCVMIGLFREMFSGRRGAMADHFYVLPEWRGAGVGKLVFPATMAVGDWFDVEIRRVPGSASMVEYYRKLLPESFKLDTVIFTEE